ncbi:hypothetical protein [Promicromonospora sp. NPDC050249]|uniref:hypothetical protein n=1 Tax=Promicromonospora sp. NPDC050249 TaxID=3154743 RepID=UPI0034023F8C
MTVDEIELIGLLIGSAGLLVALLGSVFAWLAWREATPVQPFEVTTASENIFGLRWLRWSPVKVEYVMIPHHASITTPDGMHGPFILNRGRQVFFDIASGPGRDTGIGAPIDIVVFWRPYGWPARIFQRVLPRREPKSWRTHVLAS